jgi:hypothetical protein
LPRICRYGSVCAFLVVVACDTTSDACMFHYVATGNLFYWPIPTTRLRYR